MNRLTALHVGISYIYEYDDITTLYYSVNTRLREMLSGNLDDYSI